MTEGDFLQPTGPRGQIFFITQCQGHTHLQSFRQTSSQDLGRIIPIWGHQEEMKRGIPKWGSPRSIHLLRGALSHKLPTTSRAHFGDYEGSEVWLPEERGLCQGVPMPLPGKRTPKRKLRLLLGGLPSNLSLPTGNGMPSLPRGQWPSHRITACHHF